MSKDDHASKSPPVKETPPQKANPSPHIKDEPFHPADDHKPLISTPSRSGERGTMDPLGVPPILRPTETLPVRATEPDGEPVGHARHAESEEELARIREIEDADPPLPGSRNYVAGQPVNAEERDRTENEAHRLAAAGRAQREAAEELYRKTHPGEDYVPADPDKRDTSQAQSPPKEKP